MNLEAKSVSGTETRYFCVWEAKPLQLRMLKLSFLLIILLISTVAFPVFSADRYRREDFPPGFIFGAGSSAYQVSSSIFCILDLVYSTIPSGKVRKWSSNDCLTLPCHYLKGGRSSIRGW